jgi:uncharacterized membrane protein YccC
MDWYRGLRAGTALSTPLLIADFTGLPHLGWAALGGIEAIVTDAGGPYRTRLGKLAVLTLGGALGVFLGTLAGNSLAWALPVTLIFCFTSTYLTSLGQPFASASLLVNVIYACGLGEPNPSLHEALLRGGFILLGGLWATVLSLLLWPLDPYRPARTAIGECYGALASFLVTTANHRRILRQSPGFATHPADSEAWHRANLQHKIQMRRLIEIAWDAVASVRAQTPVETAQGRQLIVLLETADLILERSVALAEHTVALLEVRSSTGTASTTDDADEEVAALERLQPFVRAVASQLKRRSGFTASLFSASDIRPGNTRHAVSHATSVEDLRSELNRFTGAFHPEAANSDAAFFALQCSEIASNLDTAFEATEALRSGSDLQSSENQASIPPDSQSLPTARHTPGKWSWNSIQSMLSAQWRPSSLILRHAARVALVCGFDVCLIQQGRVGHGYWLILTSVIVLQPHVSGTLRKGMQRVGGTVGGGILAALLALVLHSQLVTGIVLFPFATLALALLPLNYAAYAFFVTPAFVLAFLDRTGEWQLAFLRIANTVAGAAIAIAAMTVLFPSYERERIANYLRASLAANRHYLQTLIAHWSETDADPRELPMARRATGLANNDMEESLERILAESWAQKASSENLLAFAAYMHRFSQTVTGLARLPESQQWRDSPAVQARLSAVLQNMLALESELHPKLHPKLTSNLELNSESSQTPREAPDLASDPASGPTSGLESGLAPAHLSFSSIEPSAPGSSSPDLPGERQIRRLERQTQVMHRHLEALRQESWLTQR